MLVLHTLCRLFDKKSVAKIVQMSGIEKKNRIFLFYSRVQPVLSKDSAKFRLIEENVCLFVFSSFRNLFIMNEM